MDNRFYGTFDKETFRPFKSREDDYRSIFQINRDRIIHTSAFRRLQSKTQVFFSGEYDFYRTRLTHSIEVAQVGRSICDFLKKRDPLFADDFHADADLVEAACLSHDVGHPPFGHIGERKLNDLMAPWGGFEGNAQTLRILARTMFDQGRSGISPCRAMVDGILKYKTLYGELRNGKSSRPANHFLYDEQAEELDFAMAGRDFSEDLPPGPLRDSFRSLECQIMDWADDIAYSINDMADGIRAGFINSDSLRLWQDSREGDLQEEERSAVDFLLFLLEKRKVDSGLGRQIGECLVSCRLEEDANFMSESTNRYRFRLVVDERKRRQSEAFKKIALDIVFRSPQLQQIERKAGFMLNRLFEALAEQYLGAKQGPHRLLPPALEDIIRRQETETGRARAICDYLASLSDSFAIRLYRRLFDPDFGSFTDLV